MAQKDLIPQSMRTKEEQKKIARMGGKRSGEVRREKATMRAVLEAMLNEIPDKDNPLKNPNNLTYMQMATLGLIKGAVKGNSMNYKTIIETMGEDKADTNGSNGVIDNLIEALNNVRK